MKQFKDLVFKSGPKLDYGNGIVKEWLHALEFFPNGKGISVIRIKLGKHHLAYTGCDDEWEAVEIQGTQESYTIVGFPVGGMMEDDINEMMKKLQENQ